MSYRTSLHRWTLLTFKRVKLWHFEWSEKDELAPGLHLTHLQKHLQTLPTFAHVHENVEFIENSERGGGSVHPEGADEAHCRV